MLERLERAQSYASSRLRGARHSTKPSLNPKASSLESASILLLVAQMPHYETTGAKIQMTHSGVSPGPWAGNQLTAFRDCKYPSSPQLSHTIYFKQVLALPSLPMINDELV